MLEPAVERSEARSERRDVRDKLRSCRSPHVQSQKSSAVCSKVFSTGKAVLAPLMAGLPGLSCPDDQRHDQTANDHPKARYVVGSEEPCSGGPAHATQDTIRQSQKARSRLRSFEALRSICDINPSYDPVARCSRCRLSDIVRAVMARWPTGSEPFRIRLLTPLGRLFRHAPACRLFGT